MSKNLEVLAEQKAAPIISSGKVIAGSTMSGNRNLSRKTKEELKLELENKKHRDKEMLTGVFKNNEITGGSLKFSLNLPYHGEPMDEYELEDGKYYSLMRYVVDHLNNKTFVMEYARPDGTFGINTDVRNAGINHVKSTDFGSGKVKPVESKLVFRKKPRFSFFSIDFMVQDEAFANQGQGIYQLVDQPLSILSDYGR